MVNMEWLVVRSQQPAVSGCQAARRWLLLSH
jgi:hypothetical protein